jgi:SAM-dependent methyltransferase
MDELTQDNLQFLNKRFKRMNKEGVYIAHQPIYGPRSTFSEPNILERYARSYNILDTLSKLDGEWLVDIGAAEGYQASLARNLLGKKVVCVDISHEACKRAGEIFGMQAVQADARALPFAANQFDMATCSETLEHIQDYRLAVDELLRIAGKSVIITVPHEDENYVKNNRDSSTPHAHINAYNPDSLDDLSQRGILVKPRKHFSHFLHRPARLIERMRNGKPPAKLLFEDFIALVILMDAFLLRAGGNYYALSFILLKDKTSYSPKKRKRSIVNDVLNYRVPYHFLK